jgi:hypothetical protein
LFDAADIFYGILIGYYLSFHCPNDFFFKRIYQRPGMARLWACVRGLAVAHSVASFGVERVLEAKTANGGPGWGDRANLHTYLVIGFLSSAGSGILAEISNVLLLPRRVYKRPSAFGAAAGAVVALICTLLYVLVLRNPTNFTLYMPIHLFAQGLARAFNNPTLATLPAPLAAFLQNAWPAPAPNKQVAVALLSLVTVPLHVLTTPAAIERGFAWAMQRVLPGFRIVLSPVALNEQPSVQTHVHGKAAAPAAPKTKSIFGYEFDHAEDDAIAAAAADDEEEDGLTEELVASVFAPAAKEDGEEEDEEEAEVDEYEFVTDAEEEEVDRFFEDLLTREGAAAGKPASAKKPKKAKEAMPKKVKESTPKKAAKARTSPAPPASVRSRSRGRRA